MLHQCLQISYSFGLAIAALGCNDFSIPRSTDSGKTPSIQGHYLIEYRLDSGVYSAGFVAGSRGQCEQLAVSGEDEFPDSTFVCQNDLFHPFERYGDALSRIGDEYFVSGVRQDWSGTEIKGAILTEADVKTIIEYAECTWSHPSMMNQLLLTDDQNVDDTVKRLLNEVPFDRNMVRDLRITLKTVSHFGGC